MKKILEDIRQGIREDREQNGMTLYELVEKYGLSKSAVFEIIKDCDDSKVQRACPSRRVIKNVEPMIRPILSKGNLGEAARQMICARLMLNGVKVFRPMNEDTPIDLLVLKSDGSVAKGQCKYIYPGKGCHVMPLYSVRKNGPGSTAHKHYYTDKEVDFFFGYCLDNDSVYIIPFEDAAKRGVLHLWILRECTSGNGKSVFDEKKWRNKFDLLK
jgi:hypothetical protein